MISQSSHLTVHAHDDHRVGVVTDQKVLWVLGKRDHVVDGDVWVRGKRFERVEAFAGFCVPNLKYAHKYEISDTLPAT